MWKVRANEGSDVIDAEELTLSRLRSKKVMGDGSPSEPKEIRPEDDGRVLRSKKRKLVTEPYEAKEEGRIITHQINRPDSESSSAAKVNATSKQNTKDQHNALLETKIGSPRHRMRSQHASETLLTSPIRFRPTVGEWKGPALTAHVNTQYAQQSLYFRNTGLPDRDRNLTEATQLHSAFKVLDNLPDDKIVYVLSATELLNDYEDLANRDEMIDKVNFGNTIESALPAIQLKLKQLDKYDATEDSDVEEELREYKRSLKSFTALRETECLLRFREMEQDKEVHLRRQGSGVQAVATPTQIEILELCDRKDMVGRRKEWVKGTERPCMFGGKCTICLRNSKNKKLKSTNTPHVALEMPRVSAFNAKDHEECENTTLESKKSADVRRYNNRSIELQKRAASTRLELQRLQASLSFVDQYNRTGTDFLPE